MQARHRFRLASCWVVLSLAAVSRAADFSGQLAIEGRWFPASSLHAGSYRGNASLRAQPEFYHDFDSGRQRVSVALFGRWDQHDSRRTHADIRELAWEYFGPSWELRAGIRRIFWGVAESNHLVNVINQTDLVEDLDGEQKLGQPMINVALIRRWGTLDLFVLPGSHNRLFPGVRGRPGVPFLFDQTQVTYDSRRGRGAIDFAARWSQTSGPWDIGISQFYGTTRDPSYRRRTNANGESVFSPHYDRIHQTGVDLQLTLAGWLWKGELINRIGQGDRYVAFVGGFEYTFSNVKRTGMDLGLLAEYNFDERDERALTPLEDDVFVGVRLALNDVQSTAILAGAAIDRESGASFISVEGSRRFGSRWTLGVEMRSFLSVPPEDLFLFGIRNDDYFEATWSLHF